eukprot:2758701-Amphidinium_carterae.1
MSSIFVAILHLHIYSVLKHDVEEHASGSGTQTLPVAETGKQGKKGATEEDRRCDQCCLLHNKRCT